ncbi:hypothetical protein [Marinobacter sp. DSM 26671]|uniref:hypothetical protein n=1 Tax=Marinobacter sp. DSM 26671 TaxID=1761793 RepID=UPI001113D2A2|nr:hypothetical protein [Marinobacter sp. DSM 26671]
MSMSLLGRSLFRFIAAAIFIVVSVSAHTDDNVGLSDRDVGIARVAAKYGPHVIRQLRTSTDFSVPQSTLSADTRSAAVEQTYLKYVQMRTKYASAKNAGEWLSLGVGGSMALVATVAGPQATVTIPALLVGAAITTVIDIGNEDLESASQTQLRQLLKSKEEEILVDLGLSFEQLQANPERAQKAFSEGVEIFQDLRERAGGDEAVWKQSQDLIVQTLVNTDRAQWDLIEVNEENIGLVADFVVDLAVELEDFKVEVSERLDKLNAAYNNLSGKVADLEVAVVDLDERVVNLENNQAVISDFIFDEMPPSQKVRALRDRGFLANRFACEEGERTCEGSELRDSMIARFEKEADLQEMLSDAAAAAGALMTVGKIANDLGIASPELNDAVEIGNAAFGAFSGFMTGNYLGAISSITGVFSRPTDPDAERFKILMKYLQGQFEQINAKLDAVLENQEKIMNAVRQVSEQMREGFLRIERQLVNMEFEQRRISRGVRELIWTDWRNCYLVFDRSVRGIGALGAYVDPSTFYFANEDALFAIIKNSGDPARDCLVTMQADMGSLSATQRFGNFVDLQWVIDERLTAEMALPSGDAEEWRGLLLRFQQDVFRPTRTYFDRYVQQKSGLGYADAFAMLSRPMATTDDWRRGVDFVVENPFHCDQRTGPNVRLKLLLCPHGGASADFKAARLLDSPVLADIVNDIADWVLVMAQLADVRDQQAGAWVRYEELLSSAEAGELGEGSSTGELMVEAAISVVDFAIASYAMVYGPDVASLLLEDFESGGEAANRALDLASANPFLGQNLMQLFLEKRYSIAFPEEGRLRPSKTAYRAAYKLASEEQPARFLLLKGLFGTDLKFAPGESGGPALALSSGDREVLLPLPAPGEMVSGRLSWPARYYELLATREQLADRLIGYKLLDEFDQEVQLYMTRLITRPDA